MTTLEKPSSSSTPQDQSSDFSDFDPEMVQAALAYEEMLKGIQDKYDDQSVSDKLGKLYESGDKDALDKMIDDVADEAMEAHPTYTELINKIKTARANKQDVSGYAAEIDQLKDHFKEVVISMAGLPDEERFTKIEQARAQIGQLIEERVPESDRHDLTNIYKALNIMVVDEKTGKYTYRFPEEIMPDSVNKKWGTYLGSVYRHLKAVEENEGRLSGLDNRDAVRQSDSTRKNDHDSLTTDFTAVMGLKAEDGWNFTTARELIATIRDRTYPTLGSLHEDLNERKNAQHQLDENLDGVLVGELLSSKK